MLSYSDTQIQAAYNHSLKIVQGHYENFPVASLLLPKKLREPIAVIYAFARSADDFADEGDINEQQRLAKLSHYENFPVASLLLPKKLREPIAVIYAFARSADDFADEGDFNEQQRLAKLSHYEKLLDNPEHNTSSDPIFIALHDVINKHRLPIQLFRDLLSAFKQDVTKRRYENTALVMDYCTRSANPVGRLLLHLIEKNSDENNRCSDQICSSLQLINFLQDIHQDYIENNRIYLPMDEMQKYGVSESDISQQLSSPEMRALIAHQIQRARQMMLDGSALGTRIKGRFGLQLRMMINGGLQICKLLENNRENVYARPRLRAWDWISIASHSLLKQTIEPQK